MAPYKMLLTAYPVPWTASYSGASTANIVLLDGEDSAAVNKAGNLKGAVVIINIPDSTFGFAKVPEGKRYSDSDLVQLRERKMETPERWAQMKSFIAQKNAFRNFLKSKGVAALLCDDGRGSYGTVNVSAFGGYKKNAAPGLPEFIVSAEHYFKIVRTLKHGEKMSISINSKNSFNSDDLNGYNVVAEIPGSDPALKNEVVVIGAHLDSWSAATGATDNGAGCITMMEVMRILKTLGLQLKRTIRLCLWGGEEQVVLGSYGYAKKHFGDPVAAQINKSTEKIAAYYNLDNGTGKIRGIWLQGNTQLKTIFSAWLTALQDPTCTTVTPAYNGGSDQESFDAYNIPAFQFIQDPMDYDRRTHHTNMDTYEHLSFPDLKQATSVICWFVYQTAMRDQLLPRKENYVAKPFLYEGGFE